jgi:hypothetical protein
MTPRPRRWSPELQAQAEAMRREGAPWLTIGRALGVRDGTVKCWLDPAHAERRRAAARERHRAIAAARPARPPSWSGRHAVFIRVNAEALARLEQAAQALGMPRATAARHLLMEALGSLEAQGKLPCTSAPGAPCHRPHPRSSPGSTPGRCL